MTGSQSMIGQEPGQDLAQELRAQLVAIDERCRREWAAIVREINRERDNVCIPLMIFNVAAGAACLDQYAAVRDRRRDELLARCDFEKRAVMRAHEARAQALRQQQAQRREVIRRAARVRPTNLTESLFPAPDPRGPFRPGSSTRVGQGAPGSPGSSGSRGTVTADYWFLTGRPTTHLTREPRPLRTGDAPIQRLEPGTRVIVLRLGCPYSFVQTDTPECLATGRCLQGWVPTENIQHVYEVDRRQPIDPRTTIRRDVLLRDVRR